MSEDGNIGPNQRTLAWNRRIGTGTGAAALPKVALAITTVAVGLVVNIALEQRERLHDSKVSSPSDQTGQTRLAPIRLEKPDRGHPQVGSVIELVGAFENLRTEPEPLLNSSLAGSRRLPTATDSQSKYHGGKYLPDAETNESADLFLERLNPKLDHPPQTTDTAVSSSVPQHDQSAAKAASRTESEALRRYEAAKTAMQSKNYSQRDARRFYIALAHLAKLAWGSENIEITKKIAEIHQNPKLKALVCKAAPSWISWNGRNTNGIVLGGTILSSERTDPGSTVLQCDDSRLSKLNLTTHGIRRGNPLKVRDEPALFFGVIQVDGDKTILHAKQL